MKRQYSSDVAIREDLTRNADQEVAVYAHRNLRWKDLSEVLKIGRNMEFFCRKIGCLNNQASTKEGIRQQGNKTSKVTLDAETPPQLFR